MDWEGHYREEDTPWDLEGPAPPLRELLEGEFETWKEGPLLVPGCGRGHDVAYLHERGWDVIGLDLAPTALAWAKERYGSSERLRWVKGDFLDPPSDASLGGLFEHTCFCAIPPDQRRDYVEAAARWLRPGGVLVALFFLDPPKNLAEEGPPFGVSMAEISELFTQRFSLRWAMRPTIAEPARMGRELVVKMVRTD